MSKASSRWEGAADPQALKRRSVHGAAATFGAQGVKFLIQFSSQVMLARLLTPVEFGLVAMVTPLVGFVQLITDMGLAQAVIQRPELSQRQLSGIFWINASLTLGLSLLLVLAAPAVAWMYAEPRTMVLTAALAAPLLLGGLASQQIALLNRNMRFIALSAIDIGSAAAAAVVGVACAMLGLGYWSLVIMQAANSVANLIAGWTCSRWRPSAPGWDRDVTGLVTFGANVAAYNIVSYFAYNIDNVLIGVTSGNAALGLYNRAFRLMGPSIMQLSLPFTRVAVPLLSAVQDAPERYRHAFLQMLCAFLLIATPGLVFAVVMADGVMVTLLGRRWAEAGPIFAWLGVGALLMPINTSVGWLFITQGRTAEQLFWGAISSGITVGAFLVGLPWGPTGVAMSAALFMWFLNAPLFYRAATRRGPVRLAHIARATYPIAFAAAAAAGALVLLRSRFAHEGWSALILALAMSYASFGLVLACLPAGNRLLRDAGRLALMLRRRAAA